MIKKIWRKSFLFPISLIAAGIIILACGDFGDGDYYTSSFFAPEITHEEKYAEFFCTPHALYLSGIKSDYTSDFNDINLDEWGSYFQKQVKSKDLEYILYKARSGEIDTLIFKIKKSSYPVNTALKNNSILQVKETRSALDFLYYAGFAKRCEKYVTFTPYMWYDGNDPNDFRKDKAGMSALAEGGLKQMDNPKSDFVKQRYVFQLMRLYYMSKQYDKCIQFYTKQKNLLGTNPNSIKWRAMGYAAGAYYGQKQYGMADYLYSLIYANSDEMRISAYFSFHPQEEKDWNQTLALAKSPQEKAVLWQMLGTYRDPFRALKEVYAIDPKSELLDLLLARAVNTEEESFIKRFDMLSIAPNKDSTASITGMAVNKDLVAFVNTVAGKENTAKPYEWNLAAGYLGWASGDHGFQKYLDKEKAESGGDSLVMEEDKLIMLLDKIDKGKAGSYTFEKNLVPELIWLELSSHPAHFPRDFARQYIFGELSLKYFAIGDSVKAECFKCANNLTITQNGSLLNEIENFIDKKSKTTFEQFALNELPYTKKDIVEIQAVNLLYSYNFKEAYAKLNEEDSAGNEQPYGDPFVIHINDCHDCDNNGYGLSGSDEDADTNIPVVNNKKDFVGAMMNLESKLKTDPTHKAHTYFLLANGYYNMGYFGNCRVLYNSKATTMADRGFDYMTYNDTAHELPEYMYCTKAEEYYNKASVASKDPEFKAKCTFMAAKCEQNYFFIHKPKNYKGDFRGGKYFALLKSTYLNTQYYKEIIKECGYFRTYLGAK